MAERLLPIAADPGRRRLIGLLLIALLAVVGWLSVSYVVGLGPGADREVFAAVGMHLLSGKVLYREVWELKPPGIFAINALALWVGHMDMASIRVAERLFAAFGLVCFFLVVRRAFGSRAIAFLMALLFGLRLYSPSVFEGGNLTEEYGAIFVVAGILAVLGARDAQKGAWAWAFGAGAMFAAAALTKEPFLFSALPWLVYLFVHRRMRGNACGRVLAGLAGGALLLLLPFLGYLVCHHDFLTWLDVLDQGFRYSALSAHGRPLLSRIAANFGFANACVLAQTVMGTALCGVGILSCLCPSFLKKSQGLPLVILAAVAADYAGTMTSSFKYGHYYMQLVPSCLLCAACGLAFLRHLLSARGPFAAGVVPVLVVLLLLVDVGPWTAYVRRCAERPTPAPIEPVAACIVARSTPADSVWVSSLYKAYIYVQTRRCSPTRYFCPLAVHFISTKASSALEKLDLLRTELRRNPPKFIVLHNRDDLLHVPGLQEWVGADYRQANLPGDRTVLLERIESSPAIVD